MTNFKALSLIQSRNHVREHWGDDGVARIKAAMSTAGFEAVYADALLPTDWVNIDYCIEHAVAIDRVFGNGDGSTSAIVVATITTHHFNSLYRSVLATSSPRAILERSGRLWNRYYDRGDSTVEFPSETFAIKRIFNCPDMPRHHEYFLEPFYEALLKLCGAIEPHARHVECVALGAAACATEIRWKETPA